VSEEVWFVCCLLFYGVLIQRDGVRDFLFFVILRRRPAKREQLKTLRACVVEHALTLYAMRNTLRMYKRSKALFKTFRSIYDTSTLVSYGIFYEFSKQS